MKITHLVEVVSECETYKETLKCISLEEATMYADAMRAEGNSATIVPTLN